VQPPDNRITITGFTPTADDGSAGEAKAALAADGLGDVPMISEETLEMARELKAKVENVPMLGKSLVPRENRAGSNEWIISGSRTASGRPILSNDPHLALDLPPIFQEIHLITTSGLNVAGVSVPGTPGVIQGCNERICWGTTTNPLDVTDTFQEQFVLNTYGLPTATVYKGVQEPVQYVFNFFLVNQLNGVANDPKQDTSIGYLNGAITLLVPRRNYGPVLQISGSSGLSVQYAGWGPTFELESFRRINSAQNLDQFKSALTYFDVGSQNFAYADVDGNIAYFTTGEMPIRDDLQNLKAVDGAPPFIIRDGTGAKRNEWLPVTNPKPNQAIPYEILGPNEMPFVINPAAGYIANANNDPVGNTLDNNAFNQLRSNGGLYYLNFAYNSYRVGRIDRELQKRLQLTPPITATEMKALQANNQLMDAELVLPYLLTAFTNGQTSAFADLKALTQDAKVAEAITRLGAWNYSTPTGIKAGYDPGDNPNALADPSDAEIANSVAATLFATWRGQAVRAVIDARLSAVGLANYLPGSAEAYSGFKRQLDAFATLKGKGVSGLTFFGATGAPTPEAARDFVLLKALKDALNLLASDGFAPAFAKSTNLNDYRWGKLHRIVFDHPLGGPFNIPEPNGLYGFLPLAADLPGVARSGGFEAVDASSHSSKANSLNGFMFGSGPARRFVGDMTSPLPTLAQIIPGGQSGVLGSPFYASQLSRWLTNNYKTVNINVSDAVASPIVTLNFVP
jgi:penicillin amidase